MTTLMSCSFYGNKNADNMKEVKPNVKTNSIKTKIKDTVVPPDSKTRILGKWYCDEDRSSYWIFKDDGKVYSYEEGVLDSTYTYSISNSCQDNSDPKFEFLKLVNENGKEFCYEINGINENNSGILSLTFMGNFNVSLFVNNVNIKIAD